MHCQSMGSDISTHWKTSESDGGRPKLSFEGISVAVWVSSFSVAVRVSSSFSEAIRVSFSWQTSTAGEFWEL